MLCVNNVILHIVSKGKYSNLYVCKGGEMYRKQGIYERYIKRVIDVVCATGVIVVFAWLYILIALLVWRKLGNPVVFTQFRPGKDEEIFKMYKFRTMTDKRDKNGELLSDEARLTKFGKWLRSTSLDELPEVFNILRGDMSIIGPRPQLVQDMVFMTSRQRMRHTVTPGLSGLAQVNGRNAISWEEKLEWDLEYIKEISFIGDVKIVIQTVEKALMKAEGITEANMATAKDLGDALLSQRKVSKEEYDRKQAEAREILHCYMTYRGVKIGRDL